MAIVLQARASSFQFCVCFNDFHDKIFLKVVTFYLLGTCGGQRTTWGRDYGDPPHVVRLGDKLFYLVKAIILASVAGYLITL